MLIEHVSIELDPCPGMAFSVRSLLPFVPVVPVAIFPDLLVEQPFEGTHPVD